MATGNPIESRKQALRVARAAWLAMLVFQVGVGVVAWFVIASQSTTTPGGPSGSTNVVVAGVALAVLLAGTFAGYFLRQQAFKTGWTGNAVSPQAFVKGMILLYAPVEGAGTIASVLAIVTGQAVPYLALTALAIAVLAINFPTVSPMDDTLPDLTAR